MIIEIDARIDHYIVRTALLRENGAGRQGTQVEYLVEPDTPISKIVETLNEARGRPR